MADTVRKSTPKVESPQAHIFRSIRSSPDPARSRGLCISPRVQGKHASSIPKQKLESLFLDVPVPVTVGRLRPEGQTDRELGSDVGLILDDGSTGDDLGL